MNTSTRQSLCDGLARLNGINKKHVFIKYLSDAEIEKVQNFSYTQTTQIVSKEYDLPDFQASAIGKNLKYESDYLFTVKLVQKLESDIKYCINKKDQLSINVRTNDMYETFWHQDSGYNGTNYIEKGGFAVGLNILGRPTKFINYNSEKYLSKPCFDYDTIGVNYHVKEEHNLIQEEASMGEVAIWLTGAFPQGAIHSAPAANESRLFFIIRSEYEALPIGISQDDYTSE